MRRRAGIHLFLIGQPWRGWPGRRTRTSMRCEPGSGFGLFGLPVADRRFDDFAATQASRAHPYAFGAAVNHCAYPLQIRLPGSRGHVMGMTDAATGHGLLIANRALLGHVSYLLDISCEGCLPYQNRRLEPRGKKIDRELSGHVVGASAEGVHGWSTRRPLDDSGEGHIRTWPFAYKLSISSEKHALDRDGITLYLASNALTVCAQRRMNITLSGVS